LVLATLGTGLARAQAQTPAPAQNAPAAIDPQKEQLIRHLLDLLNLPQTMQNAIAPMLTQMTKAMIPSVPDEKTQKFIDLVNQRLLQKMTTVDYAGLFVPVYDKYFTVDDIKVLIAFYESPVGTKVLKLQSPMMMEVSAKITPVVEQLGKDAENEIRKEHPELVPDGSI
jgi:hypothetical protein